MSPYLFFYFVVWDLVLEITRFRETFWHLLSKKFSWWWLLTLTPGCGHRYVFTVQSVSKSAKLQREKHQVHEITYEWGKRHLTVQQKIYNCKMHQLILIIVGYCAEDLSGSTVLPTDQIRIKRKWMNCIWFDVGCSGLIIVSMVYMSGISK